MLWMHSWEMRTRWLQRVWGKEWEVVCMTPTEREMLRWLQTIKADLGQLDILVEDEKCQQANRINTKGTLAQIQYLLKSRSPVRLRNQIRHELKILRRYHMQQQSKTNPKKNRRVK